MVGMLLAEDPGTFFGKIDPPAALAPYGENGGLIVFGSNLMKLAIIVGGIIALVNIFMAGFIYLTSAGDTKAHEKVLGKLTSSLWGLALLVMAPAIMGIMGFLLFQDATYFLTPQISGPTTSTNTGSGGGSTGGRR